MINVLSIDVGILHFGLSETILYPDYTIKEIRTVSLTDITKFNHSLNTKCTLQHTKTIVDWLDHVVQDNQRLFDESTIILIERQPFGPFTAIEQLLFSRFRNKAYLISPRNVHNYLNIGTLEYDQRKNYSVKIASRFLTESNLQKMNDYERSHDIADSICMMLYWRNKKEMEYQRDERTKKWLSILDTEGLNVFEKLELFRYVPLIR
jgi:hypothetical protein